ncbi:MAG TPA: ATP-binding protein [Bdellovibrionota bacterium]|nr:ATP-binding protein [Bdellovibrionota bacterium]
MRAVSIRTRLTLGHVAALGLALILFSGLLYSLYRAQLYSQLDLELRNDLEQADDRIDLILKGEPAPSRPENWLTEIWRESGQRVFASESPEELPLGGWDAACAKSSAPYTTTSAAGLKIRVFCQESSMHRGQYVLRVARLCENLEMHLAEFLKIIGLAIPLVILFSAWMGRLLARRALDPIAEMVRRANGITASNLSERLPVANPGDELGQLALAFNEAFSRLERSFKQMRRFSSDASHELRTPLTAIRALGEVALHSGASVGDHREVISNILEETDRLRMLCDSLLTLSRADAGQIELRPEKTRLRTLVEEVLSLLSILAEEKAQTIRIDVPAELAARVDRGLFKQAVTNLIDNAIKYSAEGTAIHVSAEARAEGAVAILVRDEGPGIATEHQALIFDRFYRIDPSRSRGAGGAGLGLSIVKWITELHDGRIGLRSEVGKGSTFEIQLRG